MHERAHRRFVYQKDPHTQCNDCHVLGERWFCACVRACVRVCVRACLCVSVCGTAACGAHSTYVVISCAEEIIVGIRHGGVVCACLFRCLQQKPPAAAARKGAATRNKARRRAFGRRDMTCGRRFTHARQSRCMGRQQRWCWCWQQRRSSTRTIHTGIDRRRAGGAWARVSRGPLRPLSVSAEPPLSSAARG